MTVWAIPKKKTNEWVNNDSVGYPQEKHIDCERSLTTQCTSMLRGIQKRREKTTTDPTMLSAKNFPAHWRKESPLAFTKHTEQVLAKFTPLSSLTKCVDVQFVNEVP